MGVQKGGIRQWQRHLGTLFFVLIQLTKECLKIFRQAINLTLRAMQSLTATPLQKPIT